MCQISAHKYFVAENKFAVMCTHLLHLYHPILWNCNLWESKSEWHTHKYGISSVFQHSVALQIHWHCKEYCRVFCWTLVKFRRNMAPPISTWKNKPSRKLAWNNELNGIIAQSVELFRSTVVRTSDPTVRVCSLRRLVASFPPLRPGFKPECAYVGFYDGQKWRWGRFPPRTSVSPANLHSICLSTITFTIIRGWHNRPGVAAVPIVSQTKQKNIGFIHRLLFTGVKWHDPFRDTTSHSQDHHCALSARRFSSYFKVFRSLFDHHKSIYFYLFPKLVHWELYNNTKLSIYFLN
jgi:hypothetical protein